jgi:hypothetical protein
MPATQHMNFYRLIVMLISTQLFLTLTAIKNFINYALDIVYTYVLYTVKSCEAEILHL